jgi:zinc protease
MNRRLSTIPAIFAGFLALAPLQLASLPATAGESAKVQKVATIEGITEYRLENGVRFLLFPDPSAPTVTVNMTVLVGSRHEGYGETGMAHLLEHMLFKGSKNFPDGWKPLANRGADFNGTTWMDRTNYYETLPASDDNLEFGIKYEADRLVNSFIRREDLQKEFSVVRSEFEMNENNPETILSQRMVAIAFEWHNYGKSTIGNRTDIERVPIDRLQAFYRKYYQPDNIVLTVAGKFDEKKAIEYITTYFGAIPRPKRVLDKTYTEEPPQDGERTVALRRVGKVAVVGLVYHVPAATSPDYPAVEVLSDILVTAPSGRLYKALVETKKATRVSGSLSVTHDPGFLEFAARVSDSSTPAEVRDIMINVLENFAKNPATREEVDRARQRARAEFDLTIAKSKRVAIYLSDWIGAGDWRLMFLHRDRIAKVEPSDVDRVARAYLRQSNRTLGIYHPTAPDQVARAVIPEAPDAGALVKNYKGGKDLAKGEIFDPTPANIENRVKRLTLPSGLKVALLPKKTRGEAVVGGLTLRFGNQQSLGGYKTASSFLGSLMKRGTNKHTRLEMDDLLSKLGASLSASSTMGELSFSWQAKKASLPELLALLGEIIREPAFPKTEFEILKRANKQRLEKGLADPEALAFRYLMRQLHPHPKDDVRYQPTIEESLERLKGTTVEQVAKLYAEQLGGQNGEFVLVGDFDGDAAVKQMEGFLAGWKSDVPYQRIPDVALPVKGSRKDINTPDKENAVFVAGETLPVSNTDPVFPALRLGNYILGGSPTARLFDRLRQEEGLSYGAGSELDVSSQDKYGMLTIFAICNPQNLDRADQMALDVVARTLKKGVTEKELATAKKAYLQELKVRRASDSGLASTLGAFLHIGRTFEFYADLEKKVAALTVEDVNRAMADYLSVDRLVIVRAGDFSKKKK